MMTAAPVRFEPSQYPEQSLHGRIVHAIGRRIVGGDLQPGDLLPAETELRASRTVVREAVKVLAAKGLVESRPKIGTRVRPRDAWNLLDPDVLGWQQDGAVGEVYDALLLKLTEVRRIVEPAAAELAAVRAGSTEVDALAQAFRVMEQTARTPGGLDVEAYVQADMRFHLIILQACRNDLLEQMSRAVYSALLVSFRATSRLPGRAKASLPKHRAILDAIRAGDSWGAGAAMRHLVQSTAREVQALGKTPRPSRAAPRAPR
jgi:GntR family transcriptional regulator, galactonate operon transcriptional repressor